MDPGATNYDSTAIVDNGSCYNDGPTFHISNQGNDFFGIGTVQNPFMTIQKGINTANHLDTILVNPGTFTENINFNGKNVILGSLFLRNQDSTYIESTIINGNQNGSVITFSSGEDSTASVIGLTIQSGSNIEGGGIMISNGSSPNFYDVIIKDNISDQNGAGIYAKDNSSFKLINSKVFNNHQLSQGNSGGGIGLRNASSAHIENTIINNNSTLNWGGGIYLYTNSNATLVNSIIQNNYASQVGGGIAVDDYSSIIMTSVVIDSNTAEN